MFKDGDGMKFFPKLFFTACCFLLLLAGNSFALSVNTSDITLTAGETKQFTITGGTGFYKISSDDTSVATARVGGSTMSDGKVTGVAAGTAVVTIEDSAGDVATVNVTVSSLSVSKASLSMVVNETKEVTITAGSGFYSVSSSDPSIAEASLSNDKVSITGIAAGNATVTVTDSNNDSTDISVNVGQSFTVSPDSVSLSIGETANLSLSDKNAIYNVSSSDDAVAKASLSSGTVLVEGVSKGSAVISISSSTNYVVDVNVTVDSSIAKTVNVAPGKIESVSLQGGSGYYGTDVNDKSIAEIFIDTNKGAAAIVGKSTGYTEILVTDGKSNSFKIKVNVLLPAPDLTVDYNGTTSMLNLSWNAVANADTYALHLAPENPSSPGVPDLANLSSFLVGNNTSLSVDLKNILQPGKYFLALQAGNTGNPDINSEPSDIKEFVIP